MKNKIVKLVEQGFSVQTLSKMNESQINALYKRVINEQGGIQKKELRGTEYTIPRNVAQSTGANIGDMDITQTSTGDVKVVQKSGREKELGEAKKKKTKGKNPWAICTATMGKEFGTTERSDWSKSQMEKYEKCVMGVKEKIKEGVDPQEYFLEEQIIEILESRLTPKMNKRDFLNNVYSKSISEAEEAPVKAPPKPKTPTKPGKPDTPFKPKHKPKPKAEKSDIPSWFTWDELGINLK